ncbi:hypothetical protein [Psychrobacter fulvigenes]|uniref:hypothetical protein n=1 Tax=Psychrobacter fulvigenes TaxID=533323 RepID=UPI0019182DE7|nr:hypothetical protein [Psychrobacter fulvigenes]
MKFFYKLLSTLFSITLCIGLLSCQSELSSKPIAKAPPLSKPSTGALANDGHTATPRAPWANPVIKNSETDAIYRQEWAKSDNKALCPILALPKQASSHLASHSVRRANFAGGWGVAYDLPNKRSAYGIANAGTTNTNETFDNWPYNVNYQDGSKVGYGHEGGDPSANWLAYLVIPNNNCFYNIWSAQSKAHLEQIILDLRIVSF